MTHLSKMLFIIASIVGILKKRVRALILYSLAYKSLDYLKILREVWLYLKADLNLSYSSSYFLSPKLITDLDGYSKLKISPTKLLKYLISFLEVTDVARLRGTWKFNLRSLI